MSKSQAALPAGSRKIYNVHTYISWVECLSSLVSIM